MNTTLELLIDEAIPDHFYWAIVWRGGRGDLPRVIGSAPGPMPTRDQAKARGLEALRVVCQSDDEFDAAPRSGRVDPNAETVNGSLY